MSITRIMCGSCKTESHEYRCDGCGCNVDRLEDSVRIDVYQGLGGSGRAQLHYCAPCAVKHVPQAVGVGPGSDLSASINPPTKSKRSK